MPGWRLGPDDLGGPKEPDGDHVVVGQVGDEVRYPHFPAEAGSSMSFGIGDLSDGDAVVSDSDAGLG
jgi:hypothetical protein